MNTIEKSDVIQKDKNDEVSASHFALQIALQTMKERCQLLQHRLSDVEEENLRLRLESQNNSRKTVEVVPASDISKLEEKITQLTRQKCQLIDRISMVAKENNQLWTRLSRVTEVNQNLGNHLSKISDTLNKHPIGEVSAIVKAEVVSQSDSNSCEDGNKEESLEEISLKIIDTIRREKRVLEQQCEEMVELQTGAVSVEECGFTLTANGDIASGIVEEDMDSESDLMEDIRKLREKMKEEHKVLKDQRVGLVAAITSLNILIAEKKNCKCRGLLLENDNRSTNKQPDLKSQEITMSTLTLPLDEIHKQLRVAEPPGTKTDAVVAPEPSREEPAGCVPEENGNAFNKYMDDRICPLCSKFFSQNEPFEEFHEHVLSHFNNEGQDDESLITNFEVIT